MLLPRKLEHMNVYYLPLYRNALGFYSRNFNAAVNPELNKEEFVYYSDCQPAHPSAAAM